ncbi:MAG TPA: ribosomal protein S18-alanine N-acetyltransferase [Gemmatimonadota bacterium]|nr:ribosomal protein S18-alanine N-acetyltransferase [Gemmatimonadota bacterium]
MRAPLPDAQVRPLRPSDLAEVLSLERSVYPSPWPEEHLARIVALPGAIGQVAELEAGGIVGYALGWVAADEAELANIAVAAPHRRSGVGDRLLEAMRGEAAALGATRMYLEVRVSNEVAQAFYRSRGFSVTGRRRDYYSRPREDALTMAVALIPEAT